MAVRGDRARAGGGQAARRDLGADFGDRLSVLAERAMVELYHSAGAGMDGQHHRRPGDELAPAGLHSRLEHPPAMCFLDITGYTRLTQERGDAAAADLAEQLGRLVQRTSVKYGGRPVKWLGDGVMFFFRVPGRGWWPPSRWSRASPRPGCHQHTSVCTQVR